MDSKFQGNWHRCHGERAVALGVPPIMDPPVAPGGRSFAKNPVGDYERLSRSGGAREAGGA